MGAGIIKSKIPPPKAKRASIMNLFKTKKKVNINF